MATPEQVLADGWPYTGLRPAEVQYQPRGHAPTSQAELVQVLGVRSRLDQFGTTRDYVTLARGCTLDVWEKYPRWCGPPVLLNSAPLGEKLAGGLGGGLGDAVDAVAGLADVGRHNDRQSWKTWFERKTIAMGSGLAQFFRDARKIAAKLDGASAARLARIRTQGVYSSVEAGEALWGASFQEERPGGGSRRQFARYAVTFPCEGMDVPQRMKAEYAWGQVALQLLHKVTGKSPHVVHAPQVRLAVRSEVMVLDGTHLRRVQQLAMRAGTPTGDGADQQWFATKGVLPFVEDALRMSAGESVGPHMPETYGAEVQLRCGPRGGVYKEEPSAGSFLACVTSGVEQANQRAAAGGVEGAAINKLREELEGAQSELDAMRAEAEDADENDRDALQARADDQDSVVRDKEAALGKLLMSRPLTLEEYDSEIVVRADFAPVSSGECFVYKDPAMDEVRRQRPGEGAEGGTDAYRIERNRKMADAMVKKGAACTRTPLETRYHGGAPARRKVLGAYKGGGVPPRTQKEVILSPLDVLPWIRGV